MNSWINCISTVLKHTDRSLLETNRRTYSPSAGLASPSRATLYRTSSPDPNESLRLEVCALRKRLTAVETQQSEAQTLRAEFHCVLEEFRHAREREAVKVDSKLSEFSTRRELRRVEEQVKNSWRHQLNQVELQLKDFETECKASLSKTNQQVGARFHALVEEFITVEDMQRIYTSLLQETHQRIETFSRSIQEAIDALTETSHELYASLNKELTALRKPDSGSQLKKLQAPLVQQVDQLQARTYQVEQQIQLLQTTPRSGDMTRELTLSLSKTLSSSLEQKLTTSLADKLKQDFASHAAAQDTAYQALVDKLGDLEQRLSVQEALGTSEKLGSFHSSDQGNLTFGDEEIEELEDIHTLVVQQAPADRQNVLAGVINQFIEAELRLGTALVHEVAKRAPTSG